MISIEVNAKQLTELREACGRAKKDFSKELAAAINDTVKKTKTNISKEIRTVVNVKKKTIDSGIRTKRSSIQNLKGMVSLKHERRAGSGLQHFGAKQNARGVSYQISPKKGRKTIAGAWLSGINSKLYGGVFKRAGTTRLPIVKLYGVTPYAAYVKNDFDEIEPAFIEQKLQEQMDRRIKLNVLRANGLVSN